MTNHASGNLTGLRKVQIEKLEDLYLIKLHNDEFVSPELLTGLSEISLEIGREVAVYITRKGRIIDVFVGDNATVGLGEVKGRRSDSRLSGVRCIHTHPEGSANLSDVDFSAMDSLNLDAMAAISVSHDKEATISVALKKNILPTSGDYYDKFIVYKPVAFEQVSHLNLMEYITLLDKPVKGEKAHNNSNGETEHAILVAVRRPAVDEDVILESLKELSQLAYTAGVEVRSQNIQVRSRPDSVTYIGKGKAQEIKLQAQVAGTNVIIFDDELSPAQQRNLEDIIGIKIIDRATLILDIFAQRARTMEGQLQVELAQLNYLLPRLTGKGIALSRLGGGIGTRGPGETKLEVDRRRIRKRISDLNKQLESVKRNRELQRQKRRTVPIPVVSLCGYTNSGKSTLLNFLTKSDVLAEDKLFATLDPTTRKLPLPDGKTILLSDTVGFINKIPHHLIAAFRATLEEVIDADILLHVVDSSQTAMEQQMDAVTTLLAELGASHKPIITVFNKIDVVPPEILTNLMLRNIQDSVFLSAQTGAGTEVLLQKLAQIIPGNRRTCTYVVPYWESSLAALFHEKGKVIREEFLPEHILITAELDEKTMAKAVKYIVDQDSFGGTANNENQSD